MPLLNGSHTIFNIIWISSLENFMSSRSNIFDNRYSRKFKLISAEKDIDFLFVQYARFVIIFETEMGTYAEKTKTIYSLKTRL